MTKTKAQRRKQRRYVKRSERVKPSPLAEAKKRKWPVREMLHTGTIEPRQFEAAIAIVAGFDALTSIVNMHAGSVGRPALVLQEISDAQARQAAIYIRWANEAQSRFMVRGARVAELVRGEEPIDDSAVVLLVKLLDLWLDHHQDWDPALTRNQYAVLTPARRTASTPAASSILHAAATTAAPRAVAQATRRTRA